jgi:multidrug efflux system membrane fusion protein
VPATALQFRHDGPVVAVLGPDDRVLIRQVTIARDLGTSAEISSGVTASDRVIDNPPESLAAGDRVRIAPPLAPVKG